MQKNRTKVGILGSTGSIGRQTLDVIRSLEGRFQVVLLACYGNKTLLLKQISEFRPNIAICKESIDVVGTKTYNDLNLLSNPSLYDDCDIVINGIGGLAGLAPTLAVVQSKAQLATANKESIVSAGALVMSTAKKLGKTIIPVDSEHSAIWQCLEDKENISKLVLTASGGAFRDYSAEQLVCAKAKDALNHPTWVMGNKVTIDSATLFNKCMEVVEARNLFGINNVEVVVHRQSIVHALVGFTDGSLKASLSVPDMRLPIQYALTQGKRLPCEIKPLDLAEIGTLTFQKADNTLFPCLELAIQINSDYKGAVACAADELLVELYMKDQIGFYDIPRLISEALLHFGNQQITSVEQVLGINNEVKEYTLECLSQLRR